MYGFDLELPTDPFPLFLSLMMYMYLIQFGELVGLDETAMIGISSLFTDPWHLSWMIRPTTTF